MRLREGGNNFFLPAKMQTDTKEFENMRILKGKKLPERVRDSSNFENNRKTIYTPKIPGRAINLGPILDSYGQGECE